MSLLCFLVSENSLFLFLSANEISAFKSLKVINPINPEIPKGLLNRTQSRVFSDPCSKAWTKGLYFSQIGYCCEISYYLNTICQYIFMENNYMFLYKFAIDIFRKIIGIYLFLNGKYSEENLVLFVILLEGLLSSAEIMSKLLYKFLTFRIPI